MEKRTAMDERTAKELRIEFPTPISGIVSKKVAGTSLDVFADKKVCVFAITPDDTELIYWFHPINGGHAAERAIKESYIQLDLEQIEFACPLSEKTLKATLRLPETDNTNGFNGKEVNLFAYLPGQPMFFVGLLADSKQKVVVPSIFLDYQGPVPRYLD